jgi:hypothetical protein
MVGIKYLLQRIPYFLPEPILDDLQLLRAHAVQNVEDVLNGYLLPLINEPRKSFSLVTPFLLQPRQLLLMSSFTHELLNPCDDLMPQ